MHSSDSNNCTNFRDAKDSVVAKERVCVAKQHVTHCVSIATPPNTTVVPSAVDLQREREPGSSAVHDCLQSIRGDGRLDWAFALLL